MLCFIFFQLLFFSKGKYGIKKSGFDVLIIWLLGICNINRNIYKHCLVVLPKKIMAVYNTLIFIWFGLISLIVVTKELFYLNLLFQCWNLQVLACGGTFNGNNNNRKTEEQSTANQVYCYVTWNGKVIGFIWNSRLYGFNRKYHMICFQIKYIEF